MSDDRLESLNFPANWDRLPELEEDGPEPSPEPVEPPEKRPGSLSMTAVAWADLVTTLAVCTITLLVLIAAGHSPGIRAIPWAVGIGVVWWVVASSSLLVVRRGSVGMLLAGVVYSEPVSERRLPLILAASIVHAMMFGLAGLIGTGQAPLAAAGGSAIVVLEAPPEPS